MHSIFSFRSVLFALVVLATMMAMSTSSFAGVFISVGFAPPPLPVYVQPICPGDGYLWTPGYWAWDPDFDDYYWVPGTWVLAPEVGFLWTPPWWGWEGDVFIFHEGFWGPHVGFYGGIVYGFGYFGFGFTGGRWDGGHFFYNRAVMNINVENIHNVYEERVENVTVNHISYNGGSGGIEARPRPEDEVAARERHIGPVAAQMQHSEAARGNPELRASANHGKPPIAATPRPGAFNARGVAPAREAGGAYNRPADHGGLLGRTAAHPNDLPPIERFGSNSGVADRDSEYQAEQDRLIARQNEERLNLQKQQDEEHAELERQHADEIRRQQIEEQHRLQTNQLEQRHFLERQQLMQRYQPRPRR